MSDFTEILEQFYKITNKINSMRNKEIIFDGTEPLCTPSIHFIEVVGKNPDAKASEIAELLGITKGAVSQMSAKLIRKGLAEKHRDKQNAKEVYLTLTEKGWEVFRGHEEFHKELYSSLQAIMDRFQAGELQNIKEALSEVDRCLDQYGHI